MATTHVHADLVVPIGAPRTRDRLGALLHAGGDTATAEPVRLNVGPARNCQFPSKQVVVVTTGPRQVRSSHVFVLHWEPVGISAAAYPVLDAKVAVTAIDDGSSLLTAFGSYAPPFGPLGTAADRIAMAKVARATMTSLLRRLSRALTHGRATSGGRT